MGIFKVVKSNLDALQKRIKAIGRKLDKYGLNWNFEIIGESAESVNVYRLDPVGSGWCKIGKTVVDVVSYTFSMESLKLGEWKPIAVIEHTALTEASGTQNMVHAIDGAELLAEWWTANNVCKHCHSNRQRNKTVMLQNELSEYKQVGTTCIKDFTGIDAADIIGLYADISDIYQEEARLHSESIPQSNYTSTFNYLAFCIAEINANGYQKTGSQQKPKLIG